MKKVSLTNWYGNTQLAFEKRCEWYEETQGFHPGLDWLCPVGTRIASPVDGEGTVVSIGGVPHDWKAGPNAVAVQYRLHIVLYGHLSSVAVELGSKVKRDTVIGASGVGQGTPHLHLEVIKRDLTTSSGGRPGVVRVNPAAFMSEKLLVEFAQYAGANRFHPNDQNKWMSASDQPDIHPGKPLVFGTCDDS